MGIAAKNQMLTGNATTKQRATSDAAPSYDWFRDFHALFVIPLCDCFRAARQLIITTSEAACSYTERRTLTGEWVTTFQVASSPLNPTNTMPSTGPVNQTTGLK